MEGHIVLIDDNKLLCNAIAEQVDRRYGEKYIVDRFYDARSALGYIREDIDQDGDRLVMVGTDERMGGMQGHELLRELKKSHPRAKKFIFSAWSDTEALISGINTQVDGFVSKASTEEAGDPLFDLIGRLTDEYEAEPRLEYTVNDTTFKQAETLYEKLQFLKMRYEIYLETGYLNKEMLTEQQNQLGMEWDSFDIGGIEELVLGNRVRYLLAMKEGECMGGLRIIDGDLPLETGICVTDGSEANLERRWVVGEPFNLDYFREQELFTREISRLIIHPSCRKGGAVVLLGLFRLLRVLTSEHNELFCSSKDSQSRLYQAAGFEPCGPRINYSLLGEYIPMRCNKWKTFSEPHNIEGFSVGFHRRITEPIPANNPEKWIEYSRAVNEEVINRGFYVHE